MHHMLLFNRSCIYLILSPAKNILSVSHSIAESDVRIHSQWSLPEEVGHVGVGTVDGTKPRQQSHESDSDHTNTTD